MAWWLCFWKCKLEIRLLVKSDIQKPRIVASVLRNLVTPCITAKPRESGKSTSSPSRTTCPPSLQTCHTLSHLGNLVLTICPPTPRVSPNQLVCLLNHPSRLPTISFASCCHSIMSDSLQPHGLQHSRPPCPSPPPGACSHSCPLSRWCHPTSVVPFSSHLQSFPASGSFLMSQLFVSGGQSMGASASACVLPMNIQDRLPLGSFARDLSESSIYSPSPRMCLPLLWVSITSGYTRETHDTVSHLFIFLPLGTPGGQR